MKTNKDFYDKYGTGKNYEDLFAIMCQAKQANDSKLACKVETFIRDLKEVCENDFDKLLWGDYQTIINS